MSDYWGAGPPRPGFIGVIYAPYDSAGTRFAPAGTCFQVSPGVLVTASHVLYDAQCRQPGDTVFVVPIADAFGGPLELDESASARLLVIDPARDLAVLQRPAPLPALVTGFTPSFTEQPRTEVELLGFAIVPDQVEYPYLRAIGTWVGSVRRDGIDMGHFKSREVRPGMSGAPLMRSRDKAVLGMVSGRYISSDSSMEDSAWATSSESIFEILERVPGLVMEPRFVLAGKGAQILLVTSLADTVSTDTISTHIMVDPSDPRAAEDVGVSEAAYEALSVLRILAEPDPSSDLLQTLLDKLTDEAAASGEHGEGEKREFRAQLRYQGLEPRLLLPGLVGRERGYRASRPVTTMLADFAAVLGRQIDTSLFAQISSTCRIRLKAALRDDRSPETVSFLNAISGLLSTPRSSDFTSARPDEEPTAGQEETREADHARTRRAGAQRKCQIPVPAMYFIGRADKVTSIADAVKDTLSQRGSAVALLHGQPGVGTSEVARAVARHLSPEFTGGAYWVDLDGISSTPLESRGVVRLLAEAMDLELSGATESGVIGQFADQLADRNVLLLLDNARDAKHVAPIARHLRSCAIIVTCRDSLQSYADHNLEFPVDPLERHASIALLTEFLGARPHDLADLDEIAGLCADIPLALEMVGRRLTKPGVDPKYLCRVLRDESTRLSYLGDEERGIQAAIGLSYSLLEPDGQRSLRLIPAFPGAVVTARSLGHCARYYDTAKQELTLWRLTDCNLAVFASWAGFSLHELIRIYAAGKLKDEETPEALSDFRSMAVRYLLNRLIEINQRSPDADVQAELDPRVFHEAERLAEELDQLDIAVALATHMWLLFRSRREADQMIAASAVCYAVHLKRGDPRGATRAVLRNATELRRLKFWPYAEEAAREVLRLSALQVNDLPMYRARALFELSLIFGEQEHWRESLDHGDQAVEQLIGLHQLGDAASALLNNARFAARLGGHQRSLGYAERAEELAEQVDDTSKRVAAAFDIFSAASQLGDYQKALENSLLAERLSEQQQSWWNASASAHNSASASSRIRDGEDAAEAALIRAAGYLERDPDLSGNLVESLIDLSAYQAGRDARNRAAETLTRAVRRADDTFPLLRWEAEVRAAIVHLLLRASASVQPAASPDLRDADPTLADAQDLLAALRPGEQPQQPARDRLINLLVSPTRHHADSPAAWYYQELGEDPEEPTDV